MLYPSLIGDIDIYVEESSWTLEITSEKPDDNVEVIHFSFSSANEAPPPYTALAFQINSIRAQARWYGERNVSKLMPANWFGGRLDASLSFSLPLLAFQDALDTNCGTFAFSDAVRPSSFTSSGINESKNTLCVRFEFFTGPDASMTSYEASLRIDLRPLTMQRTIQDAVKWYEKMPECKPTPPPDGAFEPIYSTWYSYHQHLSAEELERELAIAATYGMKTVIVDDGWHTDNADTGYAVCGDWEISTKRFPDMTGHVKRVHAMGFKYMLWYSVPFVGNKTKAWDKFKGKFLAGDAFGSSVRALDPRFPEVREYLISIYENAVREWDIDGLKLDFIDYFRFNGTDEAIAQNFAGRDIKSLPVAVDRLLFDAMTRLKKIKPEILIEFRQNYISPAIRKYGNMFRASDCPGGVIYNRTRTIDLRLTSGNSAVHSDMLLWNTNDKPEIAALQILNVIFSVIQISMRLAELPSAHQKMLRFWLTFSGEHKKTLLQSSITPMKPEHNYPAVIAENGQEKIVAVYDKGQIADLTAKPGQVIFLINATLSESLTAELNLNPEAVEVWDCLGDKAEANVFTRGLTRFSMPVSGLMKLKF